MRQALHIFRKDARRFAYEICVMAAITAAFAWSATRGDPFGTWASYLRFAVGVLPFSWWYVIALLIHEDALAGDRRFWITRPYSRWSLLGAKALFVVAFMSVPLTIAQCVILAAAGFHPLDYLPNLLWVQTILAGVILLPALAFASLTRTLVQFIITILGTVAGLITLSVLMSGTGHGYLTHQILVSPGLAWTAGLFGNLLIAVPALAVFLTQWGTRRSVLAVSVGLAALVLPEFGAGSAIRSMGVSVQSRMFGQRGVDAVTVTLRADEVTPDTVAANDGIGLAPRLRVAGIAPGNTISPEIVELTFERAGGERWSTGWTQVISSEADVFQKDPTPDGTFAWWQRVVVDSGFYRRARGAPVTIRGSAYIMVNMRRGFDLSYGRTTGVTGNGRCTVSAVAMTQMTSADCVAAFHAPFNTVEYLRDAPPQTVRLISYWDSPLPAEWSMSPLFTQSGATGRGGRFLFLRYEPRAYVRRDFKVQGVRLP